METCDHCIHVEELMQIKRWFMITVRVLAFFGPFAGAAVAIIALVMR